MINVKLIVLIVFIYFWICRAEYCAVCPNHILCQYTLPGPSEACRDYDEAALLSQDDIADIVNRINEKRNFIALGLSKYYPQAANMRKIVWSKELAIFAQRWADQCDPASGPDREDGCRDLEDTAVGQTIATISGPAPGLNVKSFVDIWYMQTLDYRGSVSFYNSSQDTKTNYFTQLIWAKSSAVGCGKARFYIRVRNAIVERLVCNFAPKGNVHGKPVYSIGFAGTQCPDNMEPDRTFTGLCSDRLPNTEKNIDKSKVSAASSLLRILNLSNSSVKQEIDPLGNKLKQIKSDGNGTSDQRHQKIRHVLNNTYDEVQNAGARRRQWHHDNSKSNPIQSHHVHQPHQEKGHSRVYHGPEQPNNFVSPYTAKSIGDFRRYDITINPINSFSKTNFIKMNQNLECTRKISTECCPSSVSVCDSDRSCTRRHTAGCKHTQACSPMPFRPCADVAPHNQCNECNPPRTTCPPPTPQCACNVNNDCPKCTNYFTTHCPLIAKAGDGSRSIDEPGQAPELQYYDVLPNFALRSADVKQKPLNKITSSTNKQTWFSDSTASLKELGQNKKEHLQKHEVIKDTADYPKYKDDEHDYSFGYFDSRDRQRRESEELITMKPLWQINEYTYNKPSMLKAMRYTTLANKKNKNSWRTSTSIITEPITINVKESNTHSDHGERRSEKFLSFDELMHLRKFGEIDGRKYEPQRRVNAASTKANTTLYTATTKFQYQKHCTRKITCTWTIATIVITNSDGEIISTIFAGNVAGGGGAKTPPGYVSGCTRTSTCTRDFMTRNQISTKPIDDPEATTLEDEDYCERRDLKVQRRDSQSEYESITNQNTEYETDNIDISSTTPYVISTESNLNLFQEPVPEKDCVCYDENFRSKRQDYLFSSNSKKNGDERTHARQMLSYGDLYYLVLNKIIKSWHANNDLTNFKNCPCNASFVIPNPVALKIILLMLWLSL